MYNVTLRRICVTNGAMEKQQVLYVLSAACDAHALYGHLWPVWVYYIFPHLMNGKKLLDAKFVFYLSIQPTWCTKFVS